jgi:hypothetical protein
LRAFRDDIDGTWEQPAWPTIKINGIGLGPVAEAAGGFAARCAAANEPVVFAPPIATFQAGGGAAEKDVANGLTLTVECDQDAPRARATLERIIGPVTVVVASGGEWLDPESGEITPKLHLHWRLKEPTREFSDHIKLKEARRLAKQLVGSDGTAVPLVHPLRWPGSWHRKNTPRVARIIGGDINAEIELQDAYENLFEAAKAAGAAKPASERKASPEPQADDLDVISALAVISNINLPWNEWNNIGLATWRATGGSEIGFAAWSAWSAKSGKNDSAVTRDRWDHFAKSPPDHIGAGTLFYQADKACRGWRRPSSLNGAKTNSSSSSDNNTIHDDIHDTEEKTDPTATPWPVMASKAYHGLAGDVVRAIDLHTEADPVAILIQFLTAVGNAIGNGPYYPVEGDRHRTNLYAVLVGDTAKGRKGTSWGRVRQIMEPADQEWASERIHTGLSSGEGVIWAVRDPIKGMVPEGKGTNKRMVEQVTDAGISDKRLMVIEPEFAGALTVMERQGSILSRILRDAWDRGNLGTLTKNTPTRATGALVSLIGHVTAEELRQTLTRTSMTNGYANRFLFVCARRARILPFGGTVDSDILFSLSTRTRAAIQSARTINSVTMSQAARDGWERVYEELSAPQPGMLGAILARSEAQTIRLALLYALLDGQWEIDIEHLNAAVAVWEYCDASARYIWGDTIGDPIADEILRSLRQAGATGMTRTEISNLFRP